MLEPETGISRIRLGTILSEMIKSFPVVSRGQKTINLSPCLQLSELGTENLDKTIENN